jgi:hypothetical protein
VNYAEVENGCGKLQITQANDPLETFPVTFQRASMVSADKSAPQSHSTK